MLLYLVRHAIAVPKDSPEVLNDALRVLTRQGIRRMRRNVRGLVRIGVILDEIWTSPLTRARQTAELLAEQFPDTPIRDEAALEPGGNFDALAERLNNNRQLGSLALVGHEPSLGELATFLLTGGREHAVAFKKGGVACIELGDTAPAVKGTLQWLFTPGQLKNIK